MKSALLASLFWAAKVLPKTWEAVATRQNWAEEEVAGGTANFQHWKAAEVAAAEGEKLKR